MCVGPEAVAAIGLAAKGSAAATSIAQVASVGMGLMQGFSVYSSIQQGRQQEAMGRYNQQVAENQAIAARQKAEYDEQRHRQQARMLEGRQRAAGAASGGTLSSIGDVLDMSAEEAEMDALMIRYGGQVGQNRARSQGVQAKMQASNAASQSYQRAGASLITGAQSLNKFPR